MELWSYGGFIACYVMLPYIALAVVVLPIDTQKRCFLFSCTLLLDLGEEGGNCLRTDTLFGCAFSIFRRNGEEVPSRPVVRS
jgi:hypothetical protein